MNERTRAIRYMEMAKKHPELAERLGVQVEMKKKQEEPALKPCPFCGGEADFVGDTQSIKCKSCGGAFFVTNPCISRLEVKKVWNTRKGRENQ